MLGRCLVVLWLLMSISCVCFFGGCFVVNNVLLWWVKVLILGLIGL